MNTRSADSITQEGLLTVLSIKDTIRAYSYIGVEKHPFTFGARKAPLQKGRILYAPFFHCGVAYKTRSGLRKLMLSEVEKQFGADCHFLRVYWYDGPGTNGKTTEHHAIDKLDDFKLRLGTRNGVGTQKGVDGLIIADLISLTQQRAITHAMLITGDSDITPGVVAAQGMGLRAHLLSLGSSVATSPQPGC